MRRTNKHGLPPIIISALESWSDSYRAEDLGDITTTTLIAPPQIDALRRAHVDEMVVDAIDELYQLDGSVIHTLLETVGRQVSDDIIEYRFHREVLGWEVTGKIDRWDSATGVMEDYKRTSVWAVLDGIKPEWEAQMNVNAYLMEGYSIPVKGLSIIAWLRDWDLAKARNGGGYPKTPVVTCKVPMWTPSRQREYVEQRVRYHQAGRGGAVKPCTPEEQWTHPTKYAVMKPGRKTAVKLFEDQSEAWEYASEHGWRVEVRPGRKVRCEGSAKIGRPYCPVAGWCEQKRKESHV